MTRVGIFDSGVGGLTVWREIVRGTPHAETLYVADQKHLPYGALSRRQILAFSRGITRLLIENGCGVVVLACNTASAVALNTLREEFPAVRFVGMEPAIKPAAARSRNGIVAVLATPTTLQGALFENTAAQLETPVRIVRQPCPGLVEAIESGRNDDALEPLLDEFLRAPRAAGADTLVLACTHYPFVRHVIQRLVGPEVVIVDPAEAVARQVQRVVRDHVGESTPAAGVRHDAQLLNESASGPTTGSPSELASDSPSEPASEPRMEHTFFTTGDPESFARVAQGWLGGGAVLHVDAAHWSAGQAGEMLLRTESAHGAPRAGTGSQPRARPGPNEKGLP